MKHPPRIAVSIPASDLLRLGEEGTAALCRGADLLHVDVMDASCVPHGAPRWLARLARRTPLEVHLLARPVDALAPVLARAGARAITFHPEETEHVRRSVLRVKALGCRAGLALNPSTPTCVLDGVLEELDLVLVMAGGPCSAGGGFDPSALRRIRALRRLVDAAGLDVTVAVDGGVLAAAAAELVAAGADMLVAGPSAAGARGFVGALATARAGRRRRHVARGLA